MEALLSPHSGTTMADDALSSRESSDEAELSDDDGETGEVDPEAEPITHAATANQDDAAIRVAGVPFNLKQLAAHNVPSWWFQLARHVCLAEPGWWIASAICRCHTCGASSGYSRVCRTTVITKMKEPP